MTLDPTTIVVFVFVTFVLGGAAALASGRAVAQAWHSFARVPLYMLPLTGAVGFLHYALFGVSAIPAGAIGAAIADANIAALARWTDVAEAVAYYKRAVDLDPDDEILQLRRAAYGRSFAVRTTPRI